MSDFPHCKLPTDKTLSHQSKLCFLIRINWQFPEILINMMMIDIERSLEDLQNVVEAFLENLLLTRALCLWYPISILIRSAVMAKPTRISMSSKISRSYILQSFIFRLRYKICSILPRNRNNLSLEVIHAFDYSYLFGNHMVDANQKYLG